MDDSSQLPAALVTRRSVVLRGLAVSLVPVLGAACAVQSPTAPARRLPPPDARNERVIRVVTGLRPYRPGGFVVRRETHGTKTLVHNYGHGGCGVTLSWGTARLALDLVAEHRRGPCAVIGCGAVGLATARLFQDHGFEVTVYARELPPDTVSNIAGAWWSPYAVHHPATASQAFLDQLESAARFSFRRFQSVVGARYGVTWRDSFTLSQRPWSADAAPWSLDALMPRIALARDEHPFDAAYVYQQSSMLIEPHVYLRELMAELHAAGGRIVVRDFTTQADVLALEEPLIVNCTGLGARELFGDMTLMPVKGQLVVLVPQPEIDYVLFAPGRLYMFPRTDGVVLGGTFDPGVESLQPDPAQTARILDGHRRLAAAIRSGGALLARDA